MPPKFDKFQAVHLEIVDFTPEKHHKWSEKVWWHEGRFDSSFSAYIVFGVAIKGKNFLIDWPNPQETPEELEEDRRAEEEEKAMQADGRIGKGTSMDI